MTTTMRPHHNTLLSRIHDEDIVKARLLRALADPVRQKILRLLSEAEDTMTVETLVSHFALAQPTISHHLRILYDAGLLRKRKEGLYAYYSVRRDVLEAAAHILTDIVP